MIVRKTDVFEKWFRKIKDRTAQMLITRRIARIASEGYLGDTKPVGDGVSEIRVFFGTGYRLYYTIRGEEIIILLCGGIKTGQNKAQQEDIKLAKKLAQEV